AAPSTYSDARVTASEVVALRDRVTVHPEAGHPATWSSLAISAGGRTATAEYDTGIPERDLVRQGGALHQKFFALVEPVRGSDAAKRLAELIDGIGSLDDISVLDAAWR